MYSELFKTFTEQGEKAFAPITNYNKLVVKNIEELTALQLAAMKSYSDAGVEQLKAASEIADVQGLVDFNVKQVEAMTSLGQQMIEDGKKLAKLGQDFKSELDEMASENLEKASPVV
ncbi:phasin family protein [Aliagarivorans taiwanensis]|uniref:phasin family protein n=1 Tax=Aliagarivorans taiwanensis TaxID=561966 RepID=UPI00041648A4|nr:phasin family protein [Aliagarivorans taiwanensis]